MVLLQSNIGGDITTLSNWKSGTNSPMSSTDDGVATLTLTHSITFLGTVYTQLTLSTNGSIRFGSDTSGMTAFLGLGQNPANTFGYYSDDLRQSGITNPFTWFYNGTELIIDIDSDSYAVGDPKFRIQIRIDGIISVTYGAITAGNPVIGYTGTDTGSTADDARLTYNGIVYDGSINDTASDLVGVFVTWNFSSSAQAVTPTFLSGDYVVFDVTCFVKGTKILCLVDSKEKYLKIEDIKMGTKVKSYPDSYNKVLHKMESYIDNGTAKQNRKIYVREHEDGLTDDLYVTGNHCILTDNKTRKPIEDKYLQAASNNGKFKEVNDNKVYQVYHLVLNNKDKSGSYGIWANRILCESMSISAYNNLTKPPKNSIINNKKIKV